MTATRPTRVLVVDDSVVVRRVVSRALSAEDDIDVVGWARDGRAGVERVNSLRPDVVILDLEMPVMGGMEALAEIRRLHADLPVIIYSHLTTQSATATLEALAMGATDFALKPSADGIELAEELVREALVPLIRGLAEPAGEAPVVDAPALHTAAGDIAAVVIAVSTGGPNALAELVPALPGDLGVPVLIVQHMPPVFTRSLAERLDRRSALTVSEAGAGDEVLPGMVLLAPGGRHMAVARHGAKVEVVLDDAPPVNSCRPAADVLFRSAVEAYGSGVLAVVMTGMGHDGLSGSAAVRGAGGMVLAQSRSTCVVASMPCAVVDAGLANAVVGLGEIAGALTRCVRRGH